MRGAVFFGLYTLTSRFRVSKRFSYSQVGFKYQSCGKFCRKLEARQRKNQLINLLFQTEELSTQKLNKINYNQVWRLTAVTEQISASWGLGLVSWIWLANLGGKGLHSKKNTCHDDGKGLWLKKLNRYIFWNRAYSFRKICMIQWTSFIRNVSKSNLL